LSELLEWKEEQRKPFFCHWSNYQTLIRKFKDASEKRDSERMMELKGEIHDMAKLCGLYPMPELMRILEDTHLNDNDVAYIRNSIPFIERCIDSGSFEPIEITVNDINQLVGCNSEKCQCQHSTLRTMTGFDVIELVQEGDEIFTKFPEPKESEKPLDQPNPILQEVERLMKERGMANPNFEQQHRKQVFPEICSEQCPHVQCPYRRPQNYGKKCLSRFDEPDERVR
jgi:hypothetical protein